jgi:hypothetical protein
MDSVPGDYRETARDFAELVERRRCTYSLPARELRDAPVTGEHSPPVHVNTEGSAL